MKYACPQCGLVIVETLTPIEMVAQAGSLLALEPKLVCGRCRVVVLWGRGAITIDTAQRKMVIDGARDPKKPGILQAK